jgi:hypothetical protein
MFVGGVVRGGGDAFRQGGAFPINHMKCMVINWNWKRIYVVGLPRFRYFPLSNGNKSETVFSTLNFHATVFTSYYFDPLLQLRIVNNMGGIREAQNYEVLKRCEEDPTAVLAEHVCGVGVQRNAGKPQPSPTLPTTQPSLNYSSQYSAGLFTKHAINVLGAKSD